MIAVKVDKAAKVDLQNAIDMFADTKSPRYPLSSPLSLQGHFAVDQIILVRVFSNNPLKYLFFSYFLRSSVLSRADIRQPQFQKSAVKRTSLGPPL